MTPLTGQAFDPDTISTMSAVLERICAEIGLKRGVGKNPAAEIISEKILRHAQRGVRTREALYAATMADLKPAD
jgi:hypothetical protein